MIRAVLKWPPQSSLPRMAQDRGDKAGQAGGRLWEIQEV